MVAAYPIAKLAALVIRQVSKPLANTIKERAKHSYFFRTYICMPPAQFYHWCEVKNRMWLMGMGRSGDVPKLNEAMAMDLGANMLGESIIFVVAAVIVIMEYNRSSKKEEAREESLQHRLQQLECRLQETSMTTERVLAQLRHVQTLTVHVNKTHLNQQDEQHQNQQQYVDSGHHSDTEPVVQSQYSAASVSSVQEAIGEAAQRVKGN